MVFVDFPTPLEGGGEGVKEGGSGIWILGLWTLDSELESLA